MQFKTWLVISISVFVMMLFGVISGVYANSIGATYSQITDERSLGIIGDYSVDISDRVAFEADAQIQMGDIYNGSIDTNFIFDISTVDLKLLIENKVKGYTLDTLGRSQSLGLAFTMPVKDLNLNLDIGIGGQNSSPFAASSAYDTLVDAGFVESVIDGKGLQSLTPALKGIPFKAGNSLNTFVSTGFQLGVFEVDIKGVLEILGEGDKMHQVNSMIKTSGKIRDTMITTAIEVGLVSYQDAIYRELATITTVGYEF